MRTFSVTYEIVTPESAEYGDAEERGYILEDVSLRDAVDELFKTRTCEVGGFEAIEADCSIPEQANLMAIFNSAEFKTGARESRSLHFPKSLSVSSRVRLVELLTA